MRLRTLAVLLSLLALGGTAAAQDAPPPDVGATEATPTEGGDALGGDVGATEAAPTEAPITDAPAEEAPEDSGDKKAISVGLLLGYGIGLEGSPNAYGLGFGAGGGYTFDMGLYLGGRFVYYLGESSVNIWELGADVGYAVEMGALTIRPEIGIGVANLSITVPSVVTPLGTFGGGSASSTELQIAPGAALLYDVSDSIFIGVDARLQLILASGTYKGLLLLANVGMKF